MMFSWLRKIIGKPTTSTRRRPRPRGYPLHLDYLEARTVPAFVAPLSYAAGTAPGVMALGDFNGDGKLDIASVSMGGVAPTLSVLLGNGDGTFQPVRTAPVSAAANTGFTGAQAGIMAAADFNGDGNLDLVYTSGFSGIILLGNGDGTFQAGTPFSFGNSPTRISAADLNGDGHADLVVANTTGTVNVLLGNGDGTFAAGVSYAAGLTPQDVQVADMNKDGKPDLVVANALSAGTVSVLMGNGDGTFQPYHPYTSFSAPFRETVGDYNGDGYPDVAVANSYSSASYTVMLGYGDGSLGAPTTNPISGSPWDIETGDFNNDGKADLIEVDGNQYQVELGRGDGTFQPPETTVAPASAYQVPGIVVGDFNGDGATDFVGANTTGAVGVSLNTNNGLFNLANTASLRVASAASATAGTPLAVTVAALSASGSVVPTYTGTLVFSSSDIQAGLPASYTFTTADAGVHTFSVNLHTVGTQSVTVIDSLFPTVSGSEAGIVVTPGAAATFALTTPRIGFTGPSVTTAGVTQNFSVMARDSSGNLATGYTGTVVFSNSDVQAGLPASYTFTAADAGVASFAETLKTAGTQTLTVRDAANATVTGSEGVLVTPTAASTFSVVGGSGSAGVLRPVTVSARDVYGNFVSSYTGSVHITSSDSSAVLPADTALTGGTATVTVRMMTVGTQTLTATDTANPAMTATETISVTSALVAGFDVTGFPATVAGVSHNFTVTVRNTVGQVMTGYTGTVVFSSSDFQAGLPISYTFTAADKGAHTLAATLKTAGSQSLGVRDSANATMNGSQAGITVTAGAAASVTVGGFPATVAGDAHTLTVTVRDAYGNLASGYTGVVKFTSTDAQASLPANYTFTAADAGVHTFTATLKTAAGSQNVGGQTITVQDASKPLLVASETNILVTNAALVGLTIVVPSNIVPGTPFTLKVLAQDAFGNEVNDYRGTIHFANTAGAAGLPGDYTFTSTDNGQHGFTVTLSTTGVQTISVADIANTLLTGSVSLTVGGTAAAGGGGGGGGGGGTATGGGSGGGRKP